MKKATAFACVFGFIAALTLAPVLSAQSNRGSITGTVTDHSGAIVPGVTVTATNTDTGVASTAVTNGDGIYTIPNLFPGKYAVHFEKQGFKAEDRPNTTLESTQVAELNAKLEVGAISEKVTVTDNAPVLETETATVGTNMNGDVITDLPLSIYNGGRFVENFAVAITPGYSPLSSPYDSVVNGTQGFTKDFTVDGTSATATIQGDSMEIGPSMEAIQEVQAQTSGLDAQSGITSGGVMAFNLKSGTNKYHGSTFLYGHNEFLDANTWDNDFLGEKKAKARAWDYGGSVGGPIRKDKTFFFGAFERYDQTDLTPGAFGGASTVPTSDFLSGNFSGLLGPNLCTQSDGTVAPSCGSGTTPINVQNNAGQTLPLQVGMIFDPTTGNQFTDNSIDSGRFSGVAQKIVALYQKYYVPENQNLFNNDRLPASNSPTQTPNQAVVKIDHNLTSTNRLSGSWVYNHRPRTLIDSGGVWEPGSKDGGPLSDARDQLVYSHEIRASDAWTLTPNVVNVLNATYNWYWNGSLPASSGSDWPSALGFGSTGANNFPTISFGNAVNGVGETFVGNSWQGNYVGGTFILGDSVTWTRGRHAFTFGGDLRAMEDNYHGGSGALNFNFTNDTTGVPDSNYANFVGFGFASFLLGDVQSASETSAANLYGRRKAIDFYGQDNWKIRSDLTLSLGLRWDAAFRLHEKNGNWANFDLNAVDPNLGIPGELVYAQSGGSSFEKNEDWRNFAPSIGFAYSPPWLNHRTVVRGSFGILYVPVGIQYYKGIPYGFAPQLAGSNSAAAPFNWDAGYPGVFVPGTKTTTPPITLFPVVNVDPHSLNTGYSDNFNIGIQYELTPSTRLEVSYIGNRGHRLQDSDLNFNEASPTQFLKAVNQYGASNVFTDYVCSPSDAVTYGITYPYTGFCGPLLAAIAPYPQLALALDTYWFYPNLYYAGLPLGQSYYNSMVFEVTKRAGNGLTMDMSYTLSRQQGDTFTNFGDSYDFSGIQDLTNLGEAARTLSPYDQRNVIKGFVTYQLPFGTGKHWLNNNGRVMNAIVGGWSISGLFLYSSGQPVTIYADNPYYPGWAAVYPNLDLSGYSGNVFNKSNFNPNGGPGNQYLPASVASDPALGQFGSGPVRTNALRCPGVDNEDASVLKYFSIGSDGRYKLSLRAEFYDLFNRHSFFMNGCSGTSTTPTSSTFGQIVGVSGGPRTGQFAMRFTF